MELVFGDGNTNEPRQNGQDKNILNPYRANAAYVRILAQQTHELESTTCLVNYQPTAVTLSTEIMRSETAGVPWQAAGG